MAASQPLVAAEVLDAYRVGRHRCLLDVGGGDGSFLARRRGARPRLRLILFDLPAVAERAARALRRGRAWPARADAIGGDFLRRRAARRAPTSSRWCASCTTTTTTRRWRILRAVAPRLPPGGTLLLAEPMAETPGAEPVGDAYFGFYLLAMGSGRPRTPAELCAPAARRPASTASACCRPARRC